MSPTSSSRPFAGANARSATLETTTVLDLSSYDLRDTAGTCSVPSAASLWDRLEPCQTGTERAATPPCRLAASDPEFDLRVREPASGTVRREVEGSRRVLLATGVAALAVAASLAGCGGGERQDAHEPSATFKVDVVKASFPEHQRLADSVVMRVVVRNADTRTIPNIAVSIVSDDTKGGAGFSTRTEAPGQADPTRSLWIVDRGPRGGDTAYVSTWALGPLRAGQTRAFVWHVTPTVAGSYTLRYRVAAGLNGKAQAQRAGGGEASGTFKVSVSREPRQATVDPATGDVVNAAG